MIAAAKLCACGCGQLAGKWELSLSCANALAGMCLGKTRFRTERVARKRCRSVQRTYRCSVCGYLHNGSPEVSNWLEWKRRKVLGGLKQRRRLEILILLARGFKSMDRTEWKQNGWKGTS